MFSRCLFVCYQTCEHSIFKTSEQILMQIGTNDSQSHETLGSGVKVKVTWAKNRFEAWGRHHYRPPWVEWLF